MRKPLWLIQDSESWNLRDNRLQGWYYMKNLSRHMTRTNKVVSQQWTAVSPLLGLLSQCEAKICNASPIALPHHVFRGAWRQSVSIGVSKGKKYGAWYSERVVLQFMCVGCYACFTYLCNTVLTSPNKGKTSVRSCDVALSVLVMLVSRNVSMQYQPCSL